MSWGPSDIIAFASTVALVATMFTTLALGLRSLNRRHSALAREVRTGKRDVDDAESKDDE